MSKTREVSPAGGDATTTEAAAPVIAVRFMDRGQVRGVPARDLTVEELDQLSPTLRGEMLRPGPSGVALYEREVTK